MMKLSEAMRLGSTICPQAFNGDISGEGRCAIKSASLAVGTDLLFTHHAALLWPWLTMQVTSPCGCKYDQVLWVIVHLNDTHHWTREQIADWVEQIEPSVVGQKVSEPMASSELESLESGVPAQPERTYTA